MKSKTSKKILTPILAFALIASCLVSPAMAAPESRASVYADPVIAAGTPDGDGYVSEGNRAGDVKQEITIMVGLEGETTFQQTSDLQLATTSRSTQMAALFNAEHRIEAQLKETIEIEHRYSLLFNGFSFTGERWMVEAINTMPGVYAFEAPVFTLVEPETSDQIDLTTAMGNSTKLTTATAAWELGYTGEGMVVAVIDTGIRQTHEAFSVMPENGKIDLEYLQDVYAQYGDVIHAGSAETIKDTYYSAKLPFNWDYFDEDADPNHTASDHGTHVAGIAAGNNGTDFYGVAPDAQVVTLQVFTDAGSAGFDTLMLALEDCVYLGVDAINMSLGIAAYFTAYESVDAYMENIYAALEDAGITVCAAAGNDYHSNIYTNLYQGYYNADWFAWNPGDGTIGAPATFAGSFAVASMMNDEAINSAHFVAYGVDYFPLPSTSATTPTIDSLPFGEHDIVFAGNGSPEELEAADVAGKVALVQRDADTFTNKGLNAAAAGAAAVLIYNNVAGSVQTSASVTIPLGTLSLEDGETLRESLPDGIHGKITISGEFAYGSATMAPSSSWGTTADLLIKPEITAPGGDITSSVGFSGDDSYETWSGTSMATPHVAGGMLLVKQRLREVFPNKTAAEINQLAHTFIMDTAHQIHGMVRQQGAGLIDLESALTTETYLTVPGQDRPKLELGENADGDFTFSFTLNNFGQTDKTYRIVPSVMTELASEMNYTGYGEAEDESTSDYYIKFNDWNDFYLSNPTPTLVKTMTGTPRDVTKLCHITAPEFVTVDAGQTATVTMTIACTQELLDHIHENFASGIYLEGFIALRDQDEGANLSVPFLGFVGDWDYVPMFDQGFWWQIPYGQNNMAQMTVAQGTFIGAATLEQGLGLNPYADMNGQLYLADRHAISPNGDGFMDAVAYMEFNLMRIPKTLKLYVVDEAGNVIQTLHESTYSYRKEYFDASSGPSYSDLLPNYAAEGLDENETVYLVLEAWLDHEGYDPADNQNGRIVFPVTKDLTAPQVRAVDGGVEIVDTQYIAYYAIYADEAHTELLYETGVFAEERGAAEFYETDLDTFYVATADYARNEVFFQVDNGVVTALEEDAFNHSTKTIVARQYTDWEENTNKYCFYHYNPETPNRLIPVTDFSYTSDYAYRGYDFKSAVVAPDGTLYVCTIDDLFIMDPDTYEVTKVNTFWSTTGGTVRARTMMINPVTYEVYLYGFMSAKHHIYKLDLETAEATSIWTFDSKIPAATTLGIAAAIIDEDTMVVVDADANFWLVDPKDGTLQYSHNFNLSSQLGQNSMGGSILHDKDLNRLYIYNNWNWFRDERSGTGGMLELDLNTWELSLRTTGVGNGVTIEGLYFLEDLKPADHYVTIGLIDAIGEVTKDSREAINAARDAYDALSDYEKSLVSNYDTLLNAERVYLTLVAEEAALNAAKTYALLVINDLEAEADGCLLNAISAAREAIDYATSVGEVYAILDELQSIVAQGCVSNRFSDVAVNAWYHDSIEFVVASGLMEGMGDGTFAPEANMTRAQLVTVLYRLAGEPAVDGMTAPFTDVAADAWYADAVVWAYNAGIVTGVTETTFAPNANIRREQLVTILYRFFGEPEANTEVLAGYADATAISDYAMNAMAWAVENGIINGITESILAPQGTATRAQIATILMRVVLG